MKKYISKISGVIMAISIIAFISSAPISYAATTIGQDLKTSGKLGVGITDPQGKMQVQTVLALGTGTISSTGTAVDGIGTAFTTELRVNSEITVGSAIRRVTAIADNTNLTVSSAWSGDLTSEAFTYTNPAIYVKTTGEVGIGIGDPDQNLSIAGSLGILETGADPEFFSIFQGGDQAGNVTYTLPTGDGAATEVLATDGGGVLSWAAVGGAGGNSLDLAYGQGVSITADAGAVALTVPDDSGDYAVLTLAQNEDTNTPSALEITNAGTGTIASFIKAAAGQWLGFNDGTDVFGLYNRAGTPEANITANIGSLALDTAIGKLYIKTDDADNDSWIPVGPQNFEDLYGIDTDLVTSDADFTIDAGFGDFIVSSASWGVDLNGDATFNTISDGTATITGGDGTGFTSLVADDITIDGAAITSGTGTIDFDDENLTTTGTVDGVDVSALGAQGHDQNTDTGTTAATFTLDSDNAGAGANIDIVANQGSDNDGTIRYNATANQWEIRNDGGGFAAIASGGAAPEFEDIYSTDADDTLTTVAFDIDASGAIGIDSDAGITIGGTTIAIDSTDTTNLTMTANDGGNKTLTISATNSGGGDGLVAISTDIWDITGAGALNGLTDGDATTEDTIEAFIFDADAQEISGEWEVQDNVFLKFGNDGDAVMQYDELTDDRLEISGSVWFQQGLTTGSNITAGSTIEGGTLTDGTASITGGDGTGFGAFTASGSIEGGTLTDGTASINSGAGSGFTTFTASGAIEGGTLTDGTASINSGAISAVTGITFAQAASSISLTADGPGDLLTVEVKGATDSSLILQSDGGIGTDAVKINATAGGFSINGVNTTSNITLTANGADDDLTIAVAGAFDSSLILQSAGETTDAVKIYTTGTNGGIDLTTTNGPATITAAGAVNGDVIIDAGDDFTLDTVGTLKLNSSGDEISIGNDVVAQNIYIGTGGARTIGIGGGSATAVNLTSAGAITLTPATTVTIDSVMKLTPMDGSQPTCDAAAWGTIYVDIDADNSSALCVCLNDGVGGNTWEMIGGGNCDG